MGDRMVKIMGLVAIAAIAFAFHRWAVGYNTPPATPCTSTVPPTTPRESNTPAATAAPYANDPRFRGIGPRWWEDIHSWRLYCPGTPKPWGINDVVHGRTLDECEHNFATLRIAYLKRIDDIPEPLGKCGLAPNGRTPQMWA